MIALQANDFELFGVPEQFRQDRAVLDERWKDLQRQAHPDRFAAQGATAQRMAMQASVRINEAYQRLKDPLRRGAYLCELRGAPVQAESNTAMPADFLMQQMAWREQLEDTRDPDALEALADQVRLSRREHEHTLAVQLDEKGRPDEAVATVRALMFLDRFAREVEDTLDRIAD